MQYMIPTLTELVTSFNDRSGDITLTSTDVTNALGFTPGSSAPGGNDYSLQYNDNAGGFAGANFLTTDGERLYFGNIFGTGGDRQGQIYADNANRLLISGMDTGTGNMNGGIWILASSGTINTGGPVLINGGDSNSAGGNAGHVQIYGGRSYGSYGNGGSVELTGGTSESGGAGHVALTGADANVGNGGNIYLRPGEAGTGGEPGKIFINGPIRSLMAASLPIDGQVFTCTGPTTTPEWKNIVETVTLATLPTALYAGQQIFVSDATGASFAGSLCYWNPVQNAWIDMSTNAAVV